MSTNRKQKEKTIYDLDLHEKLPIDSDLVAMRVPGGWLYRSYSNETTFDTATTFVPWSLEFATVE